jgi:CRISPR system Cascade subunit CasB
MEEKLMHDENKIYYEDAFINSIIEKQNNSRSIAIWKKADNPILEYQAWELIAPWCHDLSNDLERLPIATIGAAFARTGMNSDGKYNLGKALFLCYPKENSTPGELRLRKILSCDDSLELCKAVKPFLHLIAAKNIKLNYGELLKDIKYFSERTKLKWANSYYKGGNKNDSKQNTD